MIEQGHKWVTKRRGGDPGDEGSYERVTVCDRCGGEKPSEDETSFPCPGEDQVIWHVATLKTKSIRGNNVEVKVLFSVIEGEGRMACEATWDTPPTEEEKSGLAGVVEGFLREMVEKQGATLAEMKDAGYISNDEERALKIHDFLGVNRN